MIKIHFLNVGHGDCIIVEFRDINRVAVIDINTKEEMDLDSYNEVINEALTSLYPADQLYHAISGYSNKQILEKATYNIQLTNPIEYMNENDINSVFRFISTHPHMDHLSGLVRLKEEIGITNLWILKNSFTPDLNELSEAQENDWSLYKKYRDTNEHQLDSMTVVRPREGNSSQYWNEDKITILSPNADLIKLAKEKNNPNIMSYVMLIEYAGQKIILGGDAEEDTWKYIHENYLELIKNVTILKASHHGRKSGYYQPVVKQMNPVYTIVSVGKKPKTDSSNDYRKHCDNVWSTRWKGNISFSIDSNRTVTPSVQYDR